jgi:Mn2+/Fe2+ NRAMP family transporter
MKKTLKIPFWLRKLGVYLAVLGPGFITASADNDAPGIATYSMVGSTYGYQFLWLILVITFGEVIVQEMAARMGVVTGKGTADLIRERFGVRVTTFAMACLLIANLGTTVAQFAGVAAAGELFGVSKYITVPLTALIISYLVLRGSYRHVEKVLLILCLSAFSYVVVAFMIKPDWGEIAKAFVVPNFNSLDTPFILAVLAVIGTTITPWGIFYMQASVADKGVEMKNYNLTRTDVVSGAVWGNIISAFIIITTAGTLFIQGIRVQSAEEAALALAPIGPAATILFSIGLLGASLLAVSVLPLSTTYAICEAFGFERGLNRTPREAPVFYSLFGIIVTISVLIVLVPKMPLFSIMLLSQSMNAILLPVLLVLLLKLANDQSLMGNWTNKRLGNFLAITLTALISLVTLVLLISPLID